MELNDWVKVFDRLLPRSKAWGLIIDRPLKRFFHGLSVLPQFTRDHIASTLLEMPPLTTTHAMDWSEQFGSTELMSAATLETEWKAFGGQSPAYIQEMLRSLGVDVYVHEWWVPGSDPVEARNPIPLVNDSLVLTNPITELRKNYKHQFGDGTEFMGDGTIEFGAYDGYYLAIKQYPCPDIPEEYPSYFYVGGPTWPDLAFIPMSKYWTLIRMIFKLKPVHLRCVLRVWPIDDSGDYDIQDTVDDPEEIQDMVTATDEEIQDYS